VNGTALVRAPSSRLAEGIVTHISRTAVQVDLARAQHAGYCEALAASGWTVRPAPTADDYPDSVFIEDTVTVSIEEPGTLDGGDVLQAGQVVYVGRGGRTNGEGIRQLRALLAPLGRTVVAVPLRAVLHLKSAVTALPDGTFLILPDLLPAELFPAVRPVTEEAGCHVVPLGGDRVLIAASAPRTAGLLADLGFTPVVVDITEFEKLEGCVTCLNVLVPGR
jgi:dimethylargininase